MAFWGGHAKLQKWCCCLSFGLFKFKFNCSI